MDLFKKRIAGYAIIVLGCLQLMVALLSWMAAIMMPASQIHSLLGSEGVRWFLTEFIDNLSSGYLTVMMLALISLGTIPKSGLHKAVRTALCQGRMSYREKNAFFLSIGIFLSGVVLFVLLTCVPHALLLDVSGDFFCRDVAVSFIALFAFVILLSSLVFGVASGRLAGIGHVVDALSYGVEVSAPLWVVAIALEQLVCSTLFVLGYQ